MSPHTDDAELGAGGLIAKYGADVAVFSFCADSLPEGNKGVLHTEFGLSMKHYGISPIRFDFPVRKFDQYRQDILELLVQLRGYDIVLCPSSDDKHQDHQVITQEASRAFKCSILGYELPWNNQKFSSDLFIGLDEDNLVKKCKALSYYDSQKRRDYFNKDFIYGLAKVRGVQSQNEYAEAFEVIRLCA